MRIEPENVLDSTPSECEWWRSDIDDDSAVENFIEEGRYQFREEWFEYLEEDFN